MEYKLYNDSVIIFCWNFAL